MIFFFSPSSIVSPSSVGIFSSSVNDHNKVNLESDFGMALL